MQKELLPSYEECEAVIENGTATALHKFIQANEPAGIEEENEFREGLAAMLTEKEDQEKGTYVVNAYRWGKIENHSYTLGVFDTEDVAIKCAESHADFRGGKYACVVEKCIMNDFDNDADNHTTEIYRTK